MPMTELERRRTIKTLKEILAKDINEEKTIPEDYLDARIVCNRETYKVDISGPISITYFIKERRLCIRNKVAKYSSEYVDLETLNRFKSILDSWANIEFGGDIND